MNIIENLADLQVAAKINRDIITSIRNLRESTEGKSFIEVPETKCLDDLIYASEIWSAVILWSTYRITEYDSRGSLQDIDDDVTMSQ